MNKRVVYLFTQGQKTEAVDLMKEVVDYAKAQFGESSVHVAKAYNNLANFYFQLEKIEEAQIYYQKAIEIEKTTLEKNDPLIAGSLFNYGMTFAAQQNKEKAKEILEESLAIYRVHSKTHQDAISRIEHLLSKLKSS